MAKMNLTPYQDRKDDLVGKPGTPEREQFDEELRVELEAERKEQPTRIGVIGHKNMLLGGAIAAAMHNAQTTKEELPYEMVDHQSRFTNDEPSPEMKEKMQRLADELVEVMKTNGVPKLIAFDKNGEARLVDADTFEIQEHIGEYLHDPFDLLSQQEPEEVHHFRAPKSALGTVAQHLAPFMMMGGMGLGKFYPSYEKRRLQRMREDPNALERPHIKAAVEKNKSKKERQAARREADRQRTLQEQARRRGAGL